MINLIAAVSHNGVIGNEGRIPWHLPEDLARFKRLTMGCTVIMGRATYESLGKPLPGRTNVVLSRDTSYSPEGVVVYSSLREALKDYPGSPTVPTWIIGGEKVYTAALKMGIVDNIFLTTVRGIYPGDAKFPSKFLQENAVNKYREASAISYRTHIDKLYVRA